MTAEDLAKAVFLLPHDEKLKVIREALAEGRAAALEEAAQEMQVFCERHAGQPICDGIAGENCVFASRIRSLLTPTVGEGK